MVSSDLGSIDLENADTGHTNGPWGHDVLNGWMDIATRPASVNPSTHSSTGVLTLNASLGHVALVTVGANITGVVVNNLVEGLPFLLILKGDGVNPYTVNLDAFAISSTVSLTDSLALPADGLIHISFSKTHNGDLWVPAGVIDFFGTTVGEPPVTGISLVGATDFIYNGTTSTTHNIVLPTGIQNTDFIEAWTVTQESTDPGAPGTPSGYTQRYSVGADIPFRPRLTKVYKFANGSESGTNLPFVWGGSTKIYGGARVLRGVHQTTPYDAAVSSTVAAGAAPNPNPASVTTVTDNAWVSVECAGNKPGGTPATFPSGYTAVHDQDTADRSLMTAILLKATAGAEDPGAFVWACENATCKTDSIRPAA